MIEASEEWTWTFPETTSGATQRGRHGHSIVWDGTRDRAVVFGCGDWVNILRSGVDDSEVQRGVGAAGRPARSGTVSLGVVGAASWRCFGRTRIGRVRRIERTKALVYSVDAVGKDERDPVNDLRILGKELKKYESSGIFGKAADGDGEGGTGKSCADNRRRERCHVKLKHITIKICFVNRGSAA